MRPTRDQGQPWPRRQPSRAASNLGHECGGTHFLLGGTIHGLPPIGDGAGTTPRSAIDPLRRTPGNRTSVHGATNRLRSSELRQSAGAEPRPEGQAELVARLGLLVKRLLAEHEVAALTAVEGAAEDVDGSRVLGLLAGEVDHALAGHGDGEVGPALEAAEVAGGERHAERVLPVGPPDHLVLPLAEQRVVVVGEESVAAVTVGV